MDGVRFGDITECGSCGLPWTADAGRNWTGVRWGMRAFIWTAEAEATGMLEAK